MSRTVFVSGKSESESIVWHMLLLVYRWYPFLATVKFESELACLCDVSSVCWFTCPASSRNIFIECIRRYGYQPVRVTGSGRPGPDRKDPSCSLPSFVEREQLHVLVKTPKLFLPSPFVRYPAQTSNVVPLFWYFSLIWWSRTVFSFWCILAMIEVGTNSRGGILRCGVLLRFTTETDRCVYHRTDVWNVIPVDCLVVDQWSINQHHRESQASEDVLCASCQHWQLAKRAH